MESEVLLLAAANLFLIIVLLVIMKKYMGLKPPEPARPPRSIKIERIRKVLSEAPEHENEENDLKTLVLGMIAAGKTDKEIVSELRKRGVREKEIKALLEESG